MSKYTVTTGQNIFDVALHIYGSIEGITDLMMNNPSLSLAASLKAGDEPEFTDGFVIQPDITAYYRMNGIIPASGERNVYYKSSAFQKVFKIRLSGKFTCAGFGISGGGTMEIDWGDNSPVKTLTLTGVFKPLSHSFNNTVPKSRNILIYGDFTLKQVDFTDLRADDLFLFRPVTSEKFVLKESRAGLDFIPLLKEVYDINLSGLKTASLLPLIENKNLMKLDLSDSRISQEALDEYLTALVKKHDGRRSMTAILDNIPSGEYREPERDFNGKYDLTCGMEAVWLLCNEPSWNEAGYWKFIIAGKTYTAAPNP